MIAFLAVGTFIVSFLALSSYKIGGKPPRSLIDYDAFRELPFVLYLLALFILCAGYFVPLFYITTYASTDLHTTTSDTAFYLLAVTNVGGFFERLVPGHTSIRSLTNDLSIIIEILKSLINNSFINY